MEQNVKTSFSSLLLPGFLALASLAMMVYGFFGESSLIGMGFVLLATSIVSGVSWYGAGISVMDHSTAQGDEPREQDRAA